MNFAERLYNDCSGVLAGSVVPVRVRTRGSVAALLDPHIWEPILLSVHFLCVVHAVHERKPLKNVAIVDRIKKLAVAWRNHSTGKTERAELDQLTRETTQALEILEGQLCEGVIRPIESQIDVARRAVHEILVGYGGERVSSTAASEIVSKVVATLDQYAKPQP